MERISDRLDKHITRTGRTGLRNTVPSIEDHVAYSRHLFPARIGSTAARSLD